VPRDDHPDGRVHADDGSGLRDRLEQGVLSLAPGPEQIEGRRRRSTRRKRTT
jgi:hypothetical protein